MMRLRNTTTFEIEKIIYSLKPKNSHVYDEISVRILKVSTPYVLLPLTYKLNKILQLGIVPDRLKFSEVKPRKVIEPNYLITGVFHFSLLSLKVLKK
jgi:hypothetical protein